MMLTFIQGEAAKSYLAENWEKKPLKDMLQLKSSLTYDKFEADIPDIYKLAKQDALPTDIRDDLYLLLRDMVSLFGNIDVELNTKRT